MCRCKGRRDADLGHREQDMLAPRCRAVSFADSCPKAYRHWTGHLGGTVPYTYKTHAARQLCFSDVERPKHT